jgi:hypothetical protein
MQAESLVRVVNAFTIDESATESSHQNQMRTKIVLPQACELYGARGPAL